MGLPDKHVGFRCPQDLRDRLERAAKRARYRKLSPYILDLLREHLERVEAKVDDEIEAPRPGGQRIEFRR